MLSTSLSRPAPKPIAASVIALSFALLSVPAAAGEHINTLFTPPLFPDGSSQLDCYLLRLAPGTEKVVTVAPNFAPRYCKFEVEGRRSDFRASILVREPGRGSISALPAE